MSISIVKWSAPLPALTMRVDLWLGLLIGAVLPLSAAMLYHPYTIAMPSWPMELTRQLGLPYVAGEFFIIFRARRAGLDFAVLRRLIPPASRWALTGFLATYWISSVAVSRHVPFSASLAIIWAVHLYTGVAVFHLARTRDIDIGRFAVGFVIGLAALTDITALHLWFPASGFGSATWRFGAPIPGFISVRLFGAWAGAVAVLLLGVAWRAERDASPAAWTYMGLALAAGLIAWTGTRAAAIGAIVALLLALQTVREAGPARFWLRAFGSMAVGAIVITSIMPPPVTGPLVRGGFSGRLALWSATLGIAVDRPLLGHGMGSNWWLVKLDGFAHVQPHNGLIEFFMNWGLIPTVAAVVLIATAAWRAHRKARAAPTLLPIVMAVDYLLTVSMFDGMLHFSEFVMLLVMLFGICLGAIPPAGVTNGLSSRAPPS